MKSTKPKPRYKRVNLTVPPDLLKAAQRTLPRGQRLRLSSILQGALMRMIEEGRLA